MSSIHAASTNELTLQAAFGELILQLLMHDRLVAIALFRLLTHRKHSPRAEDVVAISVFEKPPGVRADFSETSLYFHTPTGQLHEELPGHEHQWAIYRCKCDQYSSTSRVSPTVPWQLIGNWLSDHLTSIKIASSTGQEAGSRFLLMLDEQQLLLKPIEPNFETKPATIRQFIKLLEESWYLGMEQVWNSDFIGIADEAGRRLGIRLDEPRILRFETPQDDDNWTVKTLPLGHEFFSLELPNQVLAVRELFRVEVPWKS